MYNLYINVYTIGMVIYDENLTTGSIDILTI